MKTVLVPGAPWPVYEKPEPKPKRKFKPKVAGMALDGVTRERLEKQIKEAA